MCCCNQEPDTYSRDSHTEGVIKDAIEEAERASKALTEAVDAFGGLRDYRAASRTIGEAHARLSAAIYQANRAAALVDESMSIDGWL